MVEFVGLDVSKKDTSFCVVDATGNVLYQGKCATDPGTIFKALREACLCPELIVLETGTLSKWLCRGLCEVGLPAQVIDMARCDQLTRSNFPCFAPRCFSLGAETSSKPRPRRDDFVVNRKLTTQNGGAGGGSDDFCCTNQSLVELNEAFADAGFSVVVKEANAEALDRGLNAVRANYERSAARGSIDDEAVADRLHQIEGTLDWEAFVDCDLLIEAAFEDMAVKKSIFADLDRVAKPGAILATNTSYLDVNEIARSTSRPANVLGLHFFSPANVMRLLEVVCGDQTAPDVLATAYDVAKKIKKQPVVVGVCHGFVGNRMLAARNTQMFLLLEDGATPSQIDGAFGEIGWPMGPCEAQDVAGLDISWRVRQAFGQPQRLPDLMCEIGRLGQKVQKGWYRYDDASRRPIPDPEALKIIEQVSAEKGKTRREISADEIIDRTHGRMIEEGEQILQEGIAASSSDIDVIWVNGYGSPGTWVAPCFGMRRAVSRPGCDEILCRCYLILICKQKVKRVHRGKQ